MSGFIVAAIADLIAFCLSFSFSFNFNILLCFGGCALLPPTACGARAALLPSFIRGILETPLPTPQLSAEVFLPANKSGPFGCSRCDCTTSTARFIKSGRYSSVNTEGSVTSFILFFDKSSTFAFFFTSLIILLSLSSLSPLLFPLL